MLGEWTLESRAGEKLTAEFLRRDTFEVSLNLAGDQGRGISKQWGKHGLITKGFGDNWITCQRIEDKLQVDSIFKCEKYNRKHSRREPGRVPLKPPSRKDLTTTKNHKGKTDGSGDRKKTSAGQHIRLNQKHEDKMETLFATHV